MREGIVGGTVPIAVLCEKYGMWLPTLGQCSS